MSTYVMAACWPLQMPPSQKAVLMSLADQANDHGLCWPSVATICVRTCLSERTVRSAIGWLEENHALTIEEQRGSSSRYTITPAEFGGPVQELLPGISRTPARFAPPPCSSRRGGVQLLQEGGATAAPKPTDNHQRTIKEHTEPRTKVSVSVAEMVATCDGLSTDTAEQYLGYRKAKKAPLTCKAWETIVSEIRKTSMTPDAALAYAMSRNWQGFDAGWLPKGGATMKNRHSGFDDKDYTRGTNPDGSI
jgi:hypothetical protein